MLLGAGILTPVVVSPATRTATKWPAVSVPVMVSFAREVPLTVRSLARRPETVRSLTSLTTLVSPSR